MRITTAAFVFMIALPAALLAEVLTLKDGSKVEGTILRRSDTSITFQTSDGGARLILLTDIAAGLPPRAGGGDPAVGPAPVGSLPASAPAKTKLPTLEETLGKLLGDALTTQTQAGTVVKVSAGKVYIDLGASAGVKVGDEFEIVGKVSDVIHPVTKRKLGEEREVIARLRVDTTQAELAVCSTVSGKAEMADKAGQAYKVLPPQSAGPKTLAIGKIAAEAVTSLKSDEVKAALAKAITAGGMTLAAEAQADMVVEATAKNADGGVTVSLQTIDRKSGRSLRQVETFHRTSLSAADLGFRFAVTVELKTALNLDPIYTAIKSKMPVQWAGPAIYVPVVGAERRAALIYGDGRCVLLERAGFTKLRQLDQAQVDLQILFGHMRAAQATLHEDVAVEQWRKTAVVYAAQPGVYQGVWFALARDSKDAYIMTIPKVNVREGRLASYGVCRWETKCGLVSLDGQRTLTPTSNGKSFSEAADVTRTMQYGEHTLATEGGWCDGGFVLAQMLTDPTDASISVRDQTGKAQGNVSPPSKAISDLYVPAEITDPKGSPPPSRSEAEPAPVPVKGAPVDPVKAPTGPPRPGSRPPGLP